MYFKIRLTKMMKSMYMQYLKMLLTAKAHQNQIKKKHTGSKRHLGQEDIYQEIVTYLKDKKVRKDKEMKGMTQTKYLVEWLLRN